ncbi:MAG: DUF1326 domain-containing protein [Verrucomicrobia bacterium]|nr:DUF1326 domain-containing protein [Verrucomicrobiota bacterium]
MKLRLAKIASSVAALATVSLIATPQPTTISGGYLEVRSCDVYTGPCFANAEMGLTGKEGMIVWSVQHGSWKGTPVDGLNVIAVVHTEQTLGDVQFQPRDGRALLIVDSKATPKQKEALTDMAKSLAGNVITEIVTTRTSDIEVALNTCAMAGCASVKAGNLVSISTRCLGGDDHLCGNEETFYPPMTKVEGAFPVFTSLASFNAPGLNVTWQLTEKRSGFLATFSH